MNVAETSYVRTSDGVSLAYRTVGSHPTDLMFLPSVSGNIEMVWELPAYARYLEKLASFSRLIMYDQRGTGLSDRSAGFADLETRVRDIVAVLDALGSERTVLYGHDAGGAAAALFAASLPSRVSGLVWYGGVANRRSMYPWGATEEERHDELRRVEEGWGTYDYARRFLEDNAPSVAHDPFEIQGWARMQRHFVSPDGAADMMRNWFATDVQQVLPSVRCPTLLIDRAGVGDTVESQFIASLIPGASLASLPGTDWMPYYGDSDAIMDAVRDFLGIRRPPIDADRVLATVLFTDIVGSTERLAELGDAGWKELLTEHDERAKREIEHAGGRYIDSVGDGLFATFDGPARAVRCARAIASAVHPLGIEIRAGGHTGEIEIDGDRVRGISVHVGARVAALGQPSEILVSSTVKDLVAGSGLTFEDAGEHELKGVPDRWHLYRVVGERD